jgi:MFS family permease
MQTVAMAWLVLQVSKSAAVLGLVTMLQFLPMLLFVLPAGVVADRLPKWRILMAAQSLAALQALVLGALLLFGSPQIWQLCILASTLGLSNAFNNPTQQAFIAEMVGRSLTADAVAMNSVQFNATRMIGSGLGGLAVAQLPATRSSSSTARVSARRCCLLRLCAAPNSGESRVSAPGVGVLCGKAWSSRSGHRPCSSFSECSRSLEPSGLTGQWLRR